MLNRCFEGDGFLLPNRITGDNVIATLRFALGKLRHCCFIEFPKMNGASQQAML